MKKNRPAILLISATLFLSSCATYAVRRESVEMPAQFEATVANRTIAVLPVVIKRGSKSATAEFIPPIMEVPGIRGIADVPITGSVALIDIDDILADTRLDFDALREYLRGVAMDYLENRQDWNQPFFNGLGESNMGVISSRPYDFDHSVYPPKGSYVEMERPPALLAKAFPADNLSEANSADLTLSLSFTIEPEIVVIGKKKDNAPPLDRNHPLNDGDAYFWLTGFFEFSLTDNKTGQVIADQLTKSPFPVETVLNQYYFIAPPADKTIRIASYAETLDYADFVKDALGGAIETLCPLVDRFYKNTYHSVRVDK